MSVVVHREQKLEALSVANYIRVRRKELKRQLCDGEVHILDVLGEPEWWAQRIVVHELLSWAPGIGPARIKTALCAANVWPLKEVGSMTRRQRSRLIFELGRMGARSGRMLGSAPGGGRWLA